MIHITPEADAIYEAMVLYRNVLAEGTLLASSQAADGFAANALGPQTYDFWKPTALPASMQVTLAAPVSCDCAAFVAHTLGSSGATVTIQRQEGLSSSWVTVATVSPTDDSDILVLFGESEGIRWRFTVSGSTIPAIGVAMIGPRLIFPGGVVPDYTPINLALSVELTGSVTRGGQFLGNRVERIGAGTSIQLAPQERWWIEEEARGFIEHFNLGRPFMWASSPAILEDDTAYCWRSGGTLSASYGAGAQFGSMSMEVNAYVGS